MGTIIAMETHIKNMETFKNLVISKKLDKDVKSTMVDTIKACIADAIGLLDKENNIDWIDIKERTPTEEQFGEDFLCCVKTRSGTRYCVTEWFNPFLDGEEIEYGRKDMFPEFLLEGNENKEEVIAWSPFNRYNNLG